MESSLDELINDEHFFNMDLGVVKTILSKEENIDPKMIRIIFEKFYKTKGEDALTLIPYIKCKGIGPKAIKCLKGLSEIDFFKEILSFQKEDDENIDIDWEHYYQEEKLKVDALTKEIEKLKIQNNSLKSKIYDLEKIDRTIEKEENESKPWFQRLFKKEEPPKQQKQLPSGFKVTLLGPDQAGKTTLLKRILKDTSGDLSTYNRTTSPDFLRYHTSNGHQNITLVIWDTPGSETGLNISQSYATNAKAILLCFDVTNTDSFSKIEMFRTLAVKVAPKDTIFFLVGLKADRKCERAVSKEAAEEYASRKEMHYYETSAVDDIGVAEMMDDIVKYLYDQWNN